MIGALDTEQTLLALKIGFLVLLYLFIWAVVRSVTRDLRSVPQESIILERDRGERAQGAIRARRADGRRSPDGARQPSLEDRLRGRAAGCRHASVAAVRTPSASTGDDFASTRHAVLEPRPDGLWVEDIGSTNGTFVNGARVTTARLLAPGDVIRIGQTDLRVEA